ncbi:MAG: ATP-dependent zinc metalloprotease FtsH [Luteolibacter sp.]
MNDQTTMPPEGAPGRNQPDPPDRLQNIGKPGPRRFPLPYLPLLILIVFWIFQGFFTRMTSLTIPYSQFKNLLADGSVLECQISPDAISGKAKTKPGDTSGPPAPGGNYGFRTFRVEDPELVPALQKAHVPFSAIPATNFIPSLLIWLFPLILLGLFWSFLVRRVGNLGQSMMSFGSSKAKLVAEQDSDVTFDDVAGCDEAKAELEEVVNFLKNPDHYKALGAKIPKGILLVGPPGTGKTLLARAVAGQAKVPFFLISGSDFVEMFVGVGAARVRDLFEKAKEQAPCIVFIDELDAVGRQRGVHMGMVNDEREQTLNQLLVGMDGFEANLGVIVLAATNRPEILDRALLRPGRFDRQVVLDAPDLPGRVAILQLHIRDKPLEKEVDLKRIAQQTPGFSGADLANVVNEAALLAARREARWISQSDLEAAVEKVVAGPERKSRRLGAEEKRKVAFHETGHALVAMFSSHADPVHKISIIPRGHAALGYTMQLPAEDQHLLDRAALLDRIKGLLGGRAAEDLVFGEVSTGAENDLQHATAIARQMVAMFGMGQSVGLMHCGQRSNPFGPTTPDEIMRRDCSEQTAREIEQEVRQILDNAYAEAKTLLEEHRSQLDHVASVLLEKETLDANSLRDLLAVKTEFPEPAIGL